MTVSRKNRPQNIIPKMDLQERAKIFAPFAALGNTDKAYKKMENRRIPGEPERIRLMPAEGMTEEI